MLLWLTLPKLWKSPIFTQIDEKADRKEQTGNALPRMQQHKDKKE